MKNFIARSLSIAVSATLLATSAHALDEKALLKDYMGLTKLLRAHGIDPVQVSWKEVEPLCLPLQDAKDPTIYNGCRYEKALDQVAYRGDSSTCEGEAKTSFPENLLTAQTQAVITQDKTGSSTTATTTVSNTTSTTTSIVRPALSRKDFDAGRRSSFDRCMGAKNWNNAQDWRQGRSSR